MIRFEFVDPKEKWVGIHHYRAWRDRMAQLAPNFWAKDGILVHYAFDAENFTSAKALSQLVYCETKAAIHQSGPQSADFGCS